MNDRVTKRQVICFLPDSVNEAARHYARQAGITRQALLGMAINRHAQTLGVSVRLETKVRRLASLKPQRQRTNREDAPGRQGKSAMAGWFNAEIVTQMSLALFKRQSSMQSAGEAGLMEILRLHGEGEICHF